MWQLYLMMMLMVEDLPHMVQIVRLKGFFVAVTATQSLGRFEAYGDDGTQFTPACYINFVCDATPSTGIVPGAMAFYTNNASGVATQAAYIESNQKLSLAHALVGSYGGTGINNGALTINLGSASTGYVLTSDSSGNAAWAAKFTSNTFTPAINIGGSTTGITYTNKLVIIQHPMEFVQFQVKLHYHH